MQRTHIFILVEEMKCQPVKLKKKETNCSEIAIRNHQSAIIHQWRQFFFSFLLLFLNFLFWFFFALLFMECKYYIVPALSKPISLVGKCDQPVHCMQSSDINHIASSVRISRLWPSRNSVWLLGARPNSRLWSSSYSDSNLLLSHSMLLWMWHVAEMSSSWLHTVKRLLFFLFLISMAAANNGNCEPDYSMPMFSYDDLRVATSSLVKALVPADDSTTLHQDIQFWCIQP